MCNNIQCSLGQAACFVEATPSLTLHWAILFVSEGGKLSVVANRDILTQCASRQPTSFLPSFLPSMAVWHVQHGCTRCSCQRRSVGHKMNDGDSVLLAVSVSVRRSQTVRQRVVNCLCWSEGHKRCDTVSLTVCVGL